MRHGHRWQAACFLMVQVPWAGRQELSGKQPSGNADPITLTSSSLDDWPASCCVAHKIELETGRTGSFTFRGTQHKACSACSQHPNPKLQKFIPCPQLLSIHAFGSSAGLIQIHIEPSAIDSAAHNNHVIIISLSDSAPHVGNEYRCCLAPAMNGHHRLIHQMKSRSESQLPLQLLTTKPTCSLTGRYMNGMICAAWKGSV